VNIAKRIMKAAAIAVLFCIALTGTAVAALTYPQPLFPYHAAHGRLTLYSDRPFDAGRANGILADVDRRLSRSSLNDDNAHRIFISSSEWRRRILFLWNAGAAGVNYYPLTRNVFIGRADVDGDRVMTSSGEPKSPPRTLGYYAAHEIAHSLIKERLMPSQQLKLPRWINEGLADDIGFGGDADIDGLIRRSQSGDPDLDPARSGHYDRYRLLVGYVMKHKGWTAADLIASFMPQSEAEAILSTDIDRAVR
jgi:hypothetical protein